MYFSKCLIAIAVASALPSASYAVTYDSGSTTLTDSEYREGVTVINGASVTVDAENIAGKNFLVTNHQSRRSKHRLDSSAE